MSVLLTYGPSCEPLDEVRFLSNFSTGELGSLLLEELSNYGFDLICLQSRLTTYCSNSSLAQVIPFTTNDQLEAALEELSREKAIRAIFHAAALCDYRVTRIQTQEDQVLSHRKIPTTLGPLSMTLEPTTKIISKLRFWFPESILVGWKYEADGGEAEALRKAENQLREHQLTACIANGPALGEIFQFIAHDGERTLCSSKRELASFLAKWLHESIVRK